MFLSGWDVVAIKRDKSVVIIFIGLLAFISLYWYTYNNRQSSETIVLVTQTKEAQENSREYEGAVKVLQKINLNTSSAEELSELMFVSDEQAELIVNYRNEHGDFKSVGDVRFIKGITGPVYSSILDYTYVT